MVRDHSIWFFRTQETIVSITFRSIVLCGLLFVSSTHAQQTQRMYFIGNSVTDAMNYSGLRGVVESRENVLVQGSQRIPGAPLSFLWENIEGGFTDDPYSYPPNAFSVYTWDVLSLQPFDRSIEGIGGDREIIGKYYNLITPKSPNCKVFIYGHWPRTPAGKSELVCTQADYNTEWLGTGQESRTFYEDLTTAVRADYPATPGNIILLPIGEVFYELNNNADFLSAAGLTSIWGVYSDGIHLKGLGSYITSCLMYAVAYHDDPAGLGAPGAFGSIPESCLPYVHQTIKDVVIAKSTFTGISYFGPAPVLSVKLNAASVELNVAKTATLEPLFSPSNAANKTVTWASSNPGVAAVTDGVVAAVAGGTATITVTTEDGGFQYVCSVTVTNSGTAVTGIALNTTSTSILVGTTETLVATISPTDATNTTVVWTSSDTTIASVTSAGIVTAAKKGVTTITATSMNGLFTASASVTVTRPNNPPVAVLKFSPGNFGYAPFKVSFDGRSSSDPDPDDFVLGFDWIIKEQGASVNLKTEVSNGFDYTFTTAGVYEVTLQAVDNDQNLRSLNTEKVTITVLDMPSVPVEETAICYEGFDYVKAPITNFDGGRGWAEGWSVQNEATNTIDEFAVNNTSPITVANLRQVGNYMILGQGYSGCGRKLDVDPAGAFKDFLVNGMIGKPGTTLWFSAAIRPQSNNKRCSISFSASGIGWYTNNGDQKVDFGCFGGDYWGLAFGWDAARVEHLSTVPVVDNTPAFLVAKVEFGATNTVTLYVNPAPGDAPAVTPVVATTTSDLGFRTLGLAFSDGSNKMSIDEIRFGATYADVSPVGISTSIRNNLAEGLIGNHGVSSDELALTFNSPIAQAEIAVMSLRGRTLISKSFSNPTIARLNALSLPSGTYIVRVTTGNKVQMSKFIKQ